MYVRFAVNSELQEARLRFLQRVKAEVFKAKREGKLDSSGTRAFPRVLGCMRAYSGTILYATDHSRSFLHYWVLSNYVHT